MSTALSSSISSIMSTVLSTELSTVSSLMSSTMSTALSTLYYKVLQDLTLLSPPSIWHPFMEMVGKQFFHLWKRSGQSSKRQFSRLMEMAGKQFSRLMEMAGKQFSPFMELLVQLCLTICGTVPYCLGKWLARSFPIYGNGFRSCTSENQRLHKS